MVTLDSAGDVGLYASLELAAADLPVVSYWDGTNRDLKVARCGNVTCGAGNSIVTADPGGRVGEYTSLELDGAGRPVVTYQDYDEGALSVVRCGSADCSGGNVFTSPDGDGTAGQYTALALDAAGNPVIAYYEETSGDLRVMHCSDATCAGGKEPVPTPTANDPSQDFDGDTVTNGADTDDDNDGCPDASERQTAFGSEGSGGRRSPKNPWDYFNPSSDGENRVDDILAVIAQYFIDAPDPAYTATTDRTLAGPEEWNLSAPNGEQRVDDIINAVNQYFHDCP
jgi:hypothetical protein